MLTLKDLGSPLTFEVDQKLKQKAMKYTDEIIKPINVTPEQPSRVDYKIMETQE